MKLSLFVAEIIVTLRNHDDNNNKKIQKARGLISKTKTEGAHFLVNFPCCHHRTNLIHLDQNSNVIIALIYKIVVS